MNSAHRTGQRVRLCIAALVAAMVLVPPLVRAAQRLDDDVAAWPIRLNRGFAPPVAKSIPTPPLCETPFVDGPLNEEPPVSRIVFFVSTPDESIPDSSYYPSSHDLRGPPNTQLA